MQVFPIPKHEILIPELPRSLRQKTHSSTYARLTRNGALITGGVATVTGMVFQSLTHQYADDIRVFRPVEKPQSDYERLYNHYELNKTRSMVAYGLAITSGLIAGVSWWYEATNTQRDREAVYHRPPWFKLKPTQSDPSFYSDDQAD